MRLFLGVIILLLLILSRSSRESRDSFREDTIRKERDREYTLRKGRDSVKGQKEEIKIDVVLHALDEPIHSYKYIQNSSLQLCKTAKHCSKSFQVTEFIEKLNETSRIFLIGDSIMGQIALELAPNATTREIKVKERDKFQKGLKVLKSGLYPQIDFIYVSAYEHPKYIMEEVKIHFNFSSRDIIVVLNGAHTVGNAEGRKRYLDFVEILYDEMLRLPCEIYWLEPFPQHFSSGIYQQTRKDKYCWERYVFKHYSTVFVFTIDAAHSISISLLYSAFKLCSNAFIFAFLTVMLVGTVAK